MKVVPLELMELGKTGQCIQKRVCAFMLLELIELKKYRGAFKAKRGGGSGDTYSTAFFKYGSTPIPGKPGVDRSR